MQKEGPPPIGDPLVVESPDDFQWDEVTDMLVIGFGGAGAVTALQAMELGQEVIIVERFDGGGSTALSGGVVYAGGTDFQREAGFNDTPDEMFKYLHKEFGDVVQEETLRQFCATSSENLQWLERYGVKFSGTYYDGKTSIPPDGYFLYYSGNEKRHAPIARPAPRGHQAVGKGWAGREYFNALRKSTAMLGAKIITHASARRLIVDSLGNVIGAEMLVLESDNAVRKRSKCAMKVNPLAPFRWKRAAHAIVEARTIEDQHGKLRRFRAKNGVILATGGFIQNTQMVSQYSPLFGKYYNSIIKLGAIGCDGSGILLGQTVGGAVAHMENIYSGRAIAPPSSFVQGVIIDKYGKRITHEDCYSGDLGKAISHSQDGVGWLIVDAKILRGIMHDMLHAGGFTTFTYFLLPNLLNLLLGGTRWSLSLDRLAAKINISPDVLQKTVEDYNGIYRQGKDPLGKLINLCKPIRGGPYAAINLSVSNFLTFSKALSLGGLKVNEETNQVLREDLSVVSGLYAVGRAASGVCSRGYFSGMSLADGVFSGRKAAIFSSKRLMP